MKSWMSPEIKNDKIKGKNVSYSDADEHQAESACKEEEEIKT